MKPLRLRWLRTALLGYSPEWTAGVRRHPGLAAALPAATIGCAFVPYAGFPALAAAALLCAGLYARNEPLPLLLLCECSGARLLVRKIGTAWRNYFLAALPAAALTAALHPRTAWLAALWLPFAALLLAFPYFCDCMKGMLVNFESVEKLTPDSFILSGGIQLPISRLKYRDVREKFFDWSFAQARGGSV